MLGEVNFVARLGTSQVKLKFFVGHPLAARVILGCDFCDSHVESFHVQCKKVELFDRSPVLIVHKPFERDPDAVPLLLPQQYPEVSRRVSPQLRVVKRAVILAGSLFFVHITTERSTLLILEPSYQLYERQSLAIANGVALVTAHCPYKVLVTNVSVHDKVPKGEYVIRTVLPHPRALANVSTVPSGYVSLDAENELDFSLKRQLLQGRHTL